MEERFILPQRLKTISFVLILIGLVGIIVSFFTHASEEESKRVWANLLLNAVFFHGIAMASAFFQAATYVAYGGWHTAIKRIPEAISMFLPFTSALLLLVLAVPLIIYGHHPLYHWTDSHVVEADPILQAKTAYLNLPFFFSRFAFFVGILLLLTMLMRRNSLAEDINGG
ncbi:MAG: hypothetical protein H0V65_08535, partial [Chitinophagales bacterium]|nr:hypothetical protein [Chitinophagales bacterium]